MPNYLRHFQTTTEFKTEFNSENYLEPWVSYVDETGGIGYDGRYEEITIDSTRIYAWINGSNGWASANDSYSICVPVEVGRKYLMEFSETDSSKVGIYFRWGCSNTNTPSGQILSKCVRTSPQENSRVEIVPDRPYLVIQIGASYAESIFNNKYFTIKVWK